MPSAAVYGRSPNVPMKRSKKGVDLGLFCLVWFFLLVSRADSQSVWRREHCVPSGGLVVGSYVIFLPGSRAEPH